MHLIIITRKYDPLDSRVGFFARWLEVFAKKLDRVDLITWQRSSGGGLPSNITLHNLPSSKFCKIFALPVLVFRLLEKSSLGVFCHMMPVYAILAGKSAFFRRKPNVLWYAHSSVDWRLRLANIFVTSFITPSRESFRLSTKKKVFISGHGIDTDLFLPQKTNTEKYFIEARKNNAKVILSVGRISSSKNYEQMIQVLKKLRDSDQDIFLYIVGKVALKKDKIYLEKLKSKIKKYNLDSSIFFLGPVSQRGLPDLYTNADIFMNLSSTGSVDKSVLEASACECLAMSSNEAFCDILPSELFIKNKEIEKISDCIVDVLSLSESQKQILRKKLREEVVNHHNLDNLIKKIINFISSK